MKARFLAKLTVSIALIWILLTRVDFTEVAVAAKQASIGFVLPAFLLVSRCADSTEAVPKCPK